MSAGTSEEETLSHFPLARYAADYWWQYAKKVVSFSGCKLFNLTFHLLLNKDSALLSWIQLYNIDERFSRNIPSVTFQSLDLAQPLYYAALIGVPKIVEIVLQQDVDVNAHGGFYGNALNAASGRGYKEIVQQLLNAGADINASGSSTGTALDAVLGFLTGSITSETRVCVVKMLLDAGANFTTRSAALNDAVRFPEILKILLNTEVDVDMEGQHSSTPLQYAVWRGFDDCAQMLLGAGANPNAPRGQWGLALECASREGHHAIAQMLLDAGALLNEPDDPYNSAFIKACEEGKKDVVLTLLKAGANINEQEGESAREALQVACANNHESIVQILLKAGVDVNGKGGDFGNTLRAACSDSEPKLSLWGIPSQRWSRSRNDWDTNDKLFVSLTMLRARVKLYLYAATDAHIRRGRYVTLEASTADSYQNIMQVLLDAGATFTEEKFSSKDAQLALLVDSLESVIERIMDSSEWFDAQLTSDCRLSQSASAKCHKVLIQTMQRGYQDMATVK